LLSFFFKPCSNPVKVEENDETFLYEDGSLGIGKVNGSKVPYEDYCIRLRLQGGPFARL